MLASHFRNIQTVVTRRREGGIPAPCHFPIPLIDDFKSFFSTGEKSTGEYSGYG